MSEKNNKLEELTAESLEDMVEIKEGLQDSTPILFSEPIMIPFDNLGKSVKYNIREFNKGIEEVSRYCGMYSALVSAGFSLDDASNLVFTIIAKETNEKITELNNNAQVDIAKLGNINLEKLQI